MSDSLPTLQGQPAASPEGDLPDVEYLMIRIAYDYDPKTGESTATVGFEGQNVDAENEEIVLDVMNIAAQSLDHRIVHVDAFEQG